MIEKYESEEKVKIFVKNVQKSIGNTGVRQQNMET